MWLAENAAHSGGDDDAEEKPYPQLYNVFLPKVMFFQGFHHLGERLHFRLRSSVRRYSSARPKSDRLSVQ